MIRRRLRWGSRALALSGLLVMAAELPPARAQDAASQPPGPAIRLLVGFPAGGPSDIAARLIAEHLQTALGEPVQVENRTGAAGMLALGEMLRQPRDGHTLLLCSYLDVSNTLLYKTAAYKVDDIAPISIVSKAYYALTVPASLPVSTLRDFIAYAKARPGKLRYGSVGPGSVTQLLARQLERLAGISLLGVPFDGTGPALQEVIDGRIELMVSPLALALPPHSAGQVRILGLTSMERLPAAPDVPTLSEQGVPIANYGWWGMCAAAGTPQPVIDRLNAIVTAIVGSGSYKEAMEKQGTVPVSSTPDQLASIMAETAQDFEGLIKGLGVKPLD